MNLHNIWVLVCSGLLCTVILFSPADSSPVLLENEGTQCVYENRSYTPGEKFRPDDCTKCHCPKFGGRARCHVQDCQAIPINCLRAQKRPGECCGICLEYGCLHTDGLVYAPGQTIKDDACNHCFCPHRGGKTVCKNHKCPRQACVDAVKEENECCAKCPNGPNCWLKDKVIPAGQEVIVNDCRKCRCLQTHGSGQISYWLLRSPKKLHAVCFTKRDCQ